jgi:hypothetical protein
MRRALILAMFLVPACDRAKSPEEAATQSDVQVTDGFKYAGGVIIKDQHVLTQAAIVKGVEDTSVLDGAAKGHRARVAGRNTELNVALLYIESGGLPGATLGDSSTLTEGARLVVQVFDALGKPIVKTGTFKAWRHSEGRALIETDFDTAEIATGAGVFGPDGKLVGVLSFKLGPKFTYVMPIEYIINGPKTLTAQSIGEKKDNPGFAAVRAEAEKHTESMPTPKSYEKIDEFEYSYSKTAIVGWMRLLDKKIGGAHLQPLKWKVEAADEAQNKKLIGEGKLDLADVKWVPQPDKMAELTKEMTKNFGAGWAKEHLEPNDYGDIRFRIPIAAFCPKVTDKEVHNVTVSLVDGRAPQTMGFNDMVNICAATEEAEGGIWEKEWGFSAEVGKPSGKKVTPAVKGGKKKGRRK